MSVVADSLPALEGHTACLVGDLMVVYGGKTGPQNLNRDVFALCLSSLEWRRLRCDVDSGGGRGGSGAVPHPPLPRAYHSATVFGWRMYVFGGLLAVGIDDVHYNMYNVFANIDALDAQTLQRRGSDRLREPGSLRRVTQQKKERDALHVLDLECVPPRWCSATSYGSIPPPRAHHSATIHRSTLYIFGGYSVHTTARATDEELKAVYCVYALDLRTMTWSVVDAVNAVPPKLWGMSAVTSGDLWVVFGGVDITQCAETNAVCAWHLDYGEWRWLQHSQDAPPPVSMHTAARFGDKMIVFGGASEVSSVLTSDTYIFDLIDGSWRRVKTRGEPPLPRHGHTMVVVGQVVLIFGGLDHSLNRSARVWALDLQSFEWSVVAAQFAAGDMDNVRGIKPRAPAAGSSFLPRFLSATASSPRRISEAVQTLPTTPHDVEGTRGFAPFTSRESTDAAPAAEVGAATPRLLASATKAAPMQRLDGRSDEGISPQREVPPPLPTPRWDPTDPVNRTQRYAVAWSNDDDVLHGMRTDIAKTKSVLANMVDAAAARAERESAGFSGIDNAVAQLTNTRADGARENLRGELEARTARLRDLAQVSGGDEALAINVQHGWREELDALAQDNDLWRQATVRENALLEELEHRHLLEGQRRSMLARKMVPPSALMSSTDQAARSSRREAMQRSDEAMFPNSAAARLSDSVGYSHSRAHDPVRLAQAPKKQYVSPSLVKLGLVGQLGKGKAPVAGDLR